MSHDHDSLSQAGVKCMDLSRLMEAAEQLIELCSLFVLQAQCSSIQRLLWITDVA